MKLNFSPIKFIRICFTNIIFNIIANKNQCNLILIYEFQFSFDSIDIFYSCMYLDFLPSIPVRLTHRRSKDFYSGGWGTLFQKNIQKIFNKYSKKF